MSSDHAPNGGSFTGRRRARRTRPTVRMADVLARVCITLGGIGTIAAVLLVCVFLVWVVLPLFWPASIGQQARVAWPSASLADPPVHVGVDEYLNVIWLVTREGQLRACRADTGAELFRRPLVDGPQLTAWSFALRDGHVALAFDDSTIRLGRIVFASSFVPREEVPEELQNLPQGDIAVWGEGIVERTREGQFRLQTLALELEDPVAVKTDSAVALIDMSVSPKGQIVAFITRSGELHIAQVTQRKNLLTGETQTRLREGELQIELPEGQPPERLLLTGLGDTVLLAWADGRVERYDARVTTHPVWAESVDLVEEPGARLTCLEFLVGKTSVAAGDSLGRVHVWFCAKPEAATTVDGAVLVRAHALPPGSCEVTALAPSPRSRMLTVGYQDGTARMFHVTSNRELAQVAASAGEAGWLALAMAPKDDAFVSLDAQGLVVWSVRAPHPEITWSAILRPVHYEGSEQPEHVWQSSSGTDDFEEKYGLIPLVFGTLKATFYSMLFAVPLALLAAIYTSEFLHPRIRARVKPTIEVMASLPSVVLGFLAALFFAPLVEDILPECLTAFATVPFAFLLGASLWQLLPIALTERGKHLRPLAILITLPLGFVLAAVLGPLVERWLFAGDIMAWLDGREGTGVGAWMFVVLPVSALIVVWSPGRLPAPKATRTRDDLSPTRIALGSLWRFLAGSLITLLLALAFAYGLTYLGWDPRGTFVGTYVQRNSLIVGAMMGFAVIPIIYTIADDALSAVPESLRAASLASGATSWQTAVRIVVPTAMSGLFSAMMVGLGRAVGETMIVLMAAGNTPILDLNIFNGFRTLSANIATELPEAVANSTHYRMLFLAALMLFAMTFVVNSIAEVIRLRFRKKAFQL